MPNLLFSRPNGELLDFPDLKMAGRSGGVFVEPYDHELIPLPEGATLTAIPGRFPVGISRSEGEFSRISQNPYRKKNEEVWAVGALLPQGFTRALLPAFSAKGNKTPLPLLGYTAVGIKDGTLMAAASQTDEYDLWNPAHYNTKELTELVKKKIENFPENRIIRQLGACALEYGCFTAQNIFYGRWEGGIPVSPVCNARCIGCISSQPSECCPSPQRRLEFIPELKEVTGIAVNHLEGEKAIVSFGQGCEGEPSLQAGLIAESIKVIREKTKSGTININTNGGSTPLIRKIVDSGLDTMRLSMVSPTREIYHSYHCPVNFSFENVLESLKYASHAGVYVSLNLLAFPGVTDDESEVEALIKLIKKTGVKKIQLRNLNIDPDLFMDIIPRGLDNFLGLSQMLAVLKEELPGLAIGNYSRPVKRRGG